MEIEARGNPSHTRTLSVGIFHEDAAHVVARGVILDLRKQGLVPMAGDLQTAGLIHHMTVEARVARAGATLVHVSAEQPTVAFEPSEGTGGECCRDPVRRIEALAGSALDADFAKRLGAAIGGPRGCSHVLTLAQLLGSAARTALEADAALFGPSPERRPGQRVFQRSLSIDGLEDAEHGLSLSLQLADVHFSLLPHATDAVERLAQRLEIRAHADIDLDAMALRNVDAAERQTDPQSFDDVPWVARDVSYLNGQPALGGLARTLFAKLEDTPADRPLLDALLNLSPAIIQCIPALTNQWRRWREQAKERGGSDGRPSMMAGGGMTDSCFMWRAEGYMSGRIGEVMRGVKR